jgi:hypothetical protein
MSEPIDPNKAIDFLLQNAAKYAKAKADRIYLEEFRKSKKALLMNKSSEKAVNAREQYALSHHEYMEINDGHRAAVEVEETLKWQLIGAQLRVEVWRSMEASNRNIDRAAR